MYRRPFRRLLWCFVYLHICMVTLNYIKAEQVQLEVIWRRFLNSNILTRWLYHVCSIWASVCSQPPGTPRDHEGCSALSFFADGGNKCPEKQVSTAQNMERFHGSLFIRASLDCVHSASPVKWQLVGCNAADTNCCCGSSGLLCAEESYGPILCAIVQALLVNNAHRKKGGHLWGRNLFIFQHKFENNQYIN